MAGKAGSLLIDIAADVGQLRQDFSEAKQEVSKFGDAVAGIGRLMAGAFAGLGIAAVIGEVNSLISDVQRIAVEADKVAQRFRLTTDEAQALQLMAQRTGASIEHLVKLGERNPQWLRETTDAARQAGLVIDQEFVKGLANAAERTADLERRAKVAFAGIAEAAKRTAVYVAEVFASAFGGGQSIERLQVAIGHMREAVRNLEAQRVGVVPEVLERKRAELAQMESDLGALQKARETLNAPLPEMPATTIRAARAGGGRAPRAEVDRFAATLESLREELRLLESNAGAAAERVSDMVRKARVTDPEQIKQIRDLVEQIERLGVAREVQAEFGTGQEALAERQRELNDAFSAGKISVEEYTNATRAAQEAQAGQADQMAAMKGGVDALAAGWNTAMRSATGWQATFQQGQQLFSGSMSLMQSAISDFVRTGEIDFAKLAESFAAMLADMAAQWAAASILQSVFGLAGGGLGLGGGSIFGSLFALFGGGLQHGGPVQPGRIYTVGEAGPERFMPTVPGTIVPAAKGGDTISVNVDMGTTAGASDPAMALAFGRKVKAAVVDVITNEKRPGGLLYTRATA